MIDKDLLQILACPETHQPLQEAGADVLKRLNERILAQEARSKNGAVVADAVVAGLVRQDGKILYPIRDGIPVLLVDEGIAI